MAAMPQEAIQQGSTQPETTKPDKYSISTAEALREGYSVPEPVPETVSCKYCGRKLEYYGLVSPVTPRHVIVWKSRPERCTCSKAQDFWKDWDAKEEARKAAEAEQKAREEEMQRFRSMMERSGMKARFQNRRFENFVQDTQGRRQAYTQAKKYADNFQRMRPVKNDRNHITPPEIERNGLFKAGGYATDTRYVNKVLSIISKYNLTKYDQAAKGGVSNLKINQNPNFGTHNTSPRSGEIEYIVIHYVGATGTAKNNIDYYNQRSTTQASADFYVGFEGEKWQYNPNPKARYCWAVGGGKQSSYGGSLYGVARNANSVSIEMCVRNKGNKNANSKDWYFEQATIDSAVELTKYLMKLYGVPASRVIRHFDVNGKLCPGVYGWNSASGSESAWNDFKKRIGSGAVATPATPAQPTTAKKYYRVRKTWADAASQKGAFENYDNAKACADQNKGYKVFDWNGKQVYPAAAFQPYQVRVEITDLNIRTGPGTGYAKTQYIPVGTYTIVEEANGTGATKWGRLKSGAGWISLDYVKRV